MKISILANKKSWIVLYANKLLNLLKKRHIVKLLWDHNQVSNGDILVILSYEKLIPERILKRNKNNLVVYESDLPKGRGWSPFIWQILKRKNVITITLFEAAKKVDSGEIYLQEKMDFAVHELVDELRAVQGKHTIDLVMKYIRGYGCIKPQEQKGRPSFFRRRLPQDSELNINSSIKQQFNLLRVVDNVKYPAFFRYKGHKYILRINKADDEDR